MKFCLFITGCQYNYYDANNITHLLTKMGYVYTQKEQEANIIIVLNCSVKQKPVDRLFGNIKKWHSFKTNPKIIILGCILAKDKKLMNDRVDLVTTAENFKNDFTKHIHPAYLSLLSQKNILKNYCANDIYPADAANNTAYIPIMQGCNNFCTYCVVPYTRGRETSRNMHEIINQITDAINNKKTHIILLGQNVNSYFQPNIFKKGSAFSELLKQIELIDRPFTYNFLTSNPHDFTDEIINTLISSKKWEKILHLPIQSGNDEILNKMNRKYTVTKYLSIINKIKKSIPDIILTTDIIVGFPGETDSQFNDTYNLCKKVGFSKVFVSQYSLRPGTMASKFVQNNSLETIKKRWIKINNLINKKIS